MNRVRYALRTVAIVLGFVLVIGLGVAADFFLKATP